jgi:flagellin
VPITIGSNIASLRAQRLLGQNSSALSDLYTRLSSGLRINKASDDPAGLAEAAGLNSDARVYNQGIRNLNDGLSVLNLIDGALSQGSQIITRIKELAEQASNGVYSSAQRTAMDTEAQALRNEYNRIIATTKFNGQNLLDGTLTSLTLQAGYGVQESLTIPVSSLLPTSGTSSTTYVGTGTFKARVSYATGGFPTTVTAADLNGDGKLDIIESDYLDSTVSVQIGNGDGTFKARVSYPGGISNDYVFVADLNGDGKLDLVTADSVGNTTSVLLGNGDGTFKTSVQYSAGTKPQEVWVADLIDSCATKTTSYAAMA